MKSFSHGLFILTLLLSISSAAFCQEQKVIREHFDALAKKDVKAIAAGYADTAKVFSPNWEGAKVGAAGVSDSYSRYFSSTPDLTFKITHIINAGNAVVVEYIMAGTLSNPENGTPDYMKGKKYTIDCCAIFAVNNNLIVHETDYFDQVAFLRQVGFFDQH